ncbi:hypothetical protein ERN12_10300 [Rhodobacteraceae bacterium]|nr:hypothetical protein ERN12_10300 [Paracoccaceae bacterium]
MLLKVMALFLVVMAVLAMFGRLRLPRIGPTNASRKLRGRCKSCGRPRIGTGRCPCKDNSEV